MEWIKAKRILIILLVILNIFLLYFNFIKPKILISSDLEKKTEEILKERGVSFSKYVKIPKYEGTSPKLKYGYVDYDDKAKLLRTLVGYETEDDIKLSEQYKMGDKSLTFINNSSFIFEDTNPQDSVNIGIQRDVENYIKSFFAKIGIDLPNYKIDRYESDNSTVKVIMNQKIDKYLIFDDYWIEAQVSYNGIKYIKHRNMNVKRIEAGSKKIIPAYQALLTRYLSNNSDKVINSIDIGFNIIGVDNGTKESIESICNALEWRITIENDNKPYYDRATE